MHYQSLSIAPIIHGVFFVADNQAFEYEKYFEKEIEKKKMDHSYRVFKKVMRDATKFPAAKEFSFFPKVLQKLKHKGITKIETVSGITSFSDD